MLSPACFLLLPLLAGARAPQDEVRLPSPGVVPEGEALVAELGCLACHAGSEAELARHAPLPAPRLDAVGARCTPAYLYKLLEGPSRLRHGTRMPDLLAVLPEEERRETREDLLHFLVARGGPLEPSRGQATLGMLEEGRQLLHEVGCVACHEPPESIDALVEPFSFEAAASSPQAAELYVPDGTLPAPRVPLGDQARRTSLEALQAFLLDPVAVRPSGRMPSSQLTPGEAHDIALYLLRDQVAAAGGPRPRPGLRYRYYEGSFGPGRPQLSGLQSDAEGIHLGEVGLPDHREDGFAFEFDGSLKLARGGLYTFRLVSDDGSWLEVDGRELIDNGGDHAPQSVEAELELSAGEHPIRITYYENGGGEELALFWSGPGFEERPLDTNDLEFLALELDVEGLEDFALDLQRVARGKAAFGELGCAACHEETTPRAKPFSDCDPDAPGACTSEVPGRGRPRYGWSESQRAAVVALLRRAEAPAPLSPAERVERSLATNRCLACHRRAGRGGPHPERRPYFFSRDDVDLGEEGRIPPPLDAVGQKLEAEWLERVLQEGASVRPDLLTRMPLFGERALEGLMDDFAATDRTPGERPEPAFSHELMLAGRQLTGTSGFGCIQCHRFAGFDSLGIPAVDLAEVRGRLRFPWFHTLLTDPERLDMNTRMPIFLVDGESPVRDVLEGDLERQIEALWSYLSLGSSAPLPPGLNLPDSTYEVEVDPEGEPVAVGAFMAGISPRVVAVGTPEHLHYAFDVENSRLAMVWRGRFFNARGTWEGRAGELELPPSEDRHELPAGPAFARLADRDAPWPEVVDRRPRLRALGRRWDAERYPVFRYALDGIEIEESLRPREEDGQLVLLRRFRLRAPEAASDLWFQDEAGRRAIEWSPAPEGDGVVAELESRVSW